jgi:hypothetical protein
MEIYPTASCEARDEGKEPQFFRGREVSLTKLKPGWRHVVASFKRLRAES